MSKKAFIFLLLFSCALFYLPFPQKTKAISLDDVEDYLSLKEDNAKRLLSSTLETISKRYLELTVNTSSSAKDQAVTLIVRKGIKEHILNYHFSYLIQKLGKEALRAVYKTALFIYSPDKTSFFLEEFEKLSVELATEKATELLLKNEMKVGSGKLPVTYKSMEKGLQRVEFPYFVVYKPDKKNSLKKAEVSISFYSKESIPIPAVNSRNFWYADEYEKDKLPPFILQIKGEIERTDHNYYKWTTTPEIKIEYPAEVPDLDLQKQGFFEKITRIIGFIFQKIQGLFGREKEERELFTSSLQDLGEEEEERGVQDEKEKDTTKESPEEKEKSSPEKTDPEKTDTDKEEAKKEPASTAPRKQKEESSTMSLTEIEAAIQEARQKVKKITDEVEKVQTEQKKVLGETKEQALTPCPTKKRNQIAAKNKVIINEMAWMGTESSHYNEWIELKNITDEPIDLSNWQLVDKNEDINIIFEAGTTLPANSFFLLERTDESTLPHLKAELVYTGGLSNSNEAVYLFNKQCQLQDKVSTISSWPGGDNSTKKTMERSDDLSWQTSIIEGGTPKGENTKGEPSDPTSDSDSEATDENMQENETNSEGENQQESNPNSQPQEPEEETLPSYCSLKNLEPAVQAPIIINEVSWMGTKASATDEWIELKNISEGIILLEGWQLLDQGKDIRIIFEEDEVINKNRFYLLERTNNNSVPGISADKIYTGALSNTEEGIYLFNKECKLIDKVEAAPDWPAGSNSPKKTMERAPNLTWYTYTGEETMINGTPKEENSPPPAPESPEEQEETEEKTCSCDPYWTKRGCGGNNCASDKMWETRSCNPSGCEQETRCVYNAECIMEEEEEEEGKEQEEEEKQKDLPKDIVINEIAWMGTKASATDEWIELYNASSSEVNLAGWTLSAQDGSPEIDLTGTIPKNGFYLLERTDDETISDIKADWRGPFGSGGIKNSGELLSLKNPQNVLIDEVDCLDGWFAGDNASTTKSSMERIDAQTSGSDPKNWVQNNGKVRNGKDAKGAPINGTPKALNSPLQIPEKIIDLKTTSKNMSNTSVELSWSAPKDYNSKQEDLSYDIRYLIDTPLTENNWEKAMRLKGEPNVSSPGSLEKKTIWPLNYDRTYYFAIKTSDGEHISSLSNVVSFKTGSPSKDFIWPQFRKNAQKNAYVPTSGPDNLENIKIATEKNAIRDAVIGAHDIIYYSTDKGIGSLSPNLEEKWFRRTDEYLSALAILPDGTIIGRSHTLFAFDQLGNKLWEFPLSVNYHRPPTVYEDKIYLLGKCANEDWNKSTGLSLFEINKNGELNWFFDTKNVEAGIQKKLGFPCQDQGGSSGYYNSVPAVSNNTIYFGDEKNLYAVSPSQGLKWKTEFTKRFNSCSPPSIGPDGTIYVYLNKALRAFTSTGEEKWIIPNLSSAPAGPVIGSNKKLYFPHRYYGWPWFLIVDPETGEKLEGTPWRVLSNKDNAKGTSPALITDNKVYFAGNRFTTGYVNIYKIGTEKIESFRPPFPVGERSRVTKFLAKPDGTLFILAGHLYVIPP